MYRGTTPTLYFKIKNIEDLKKIKECWITIKSKINTLNKDLDQITIDEENKALVLQLSQQETLMFKGSHLDIQIKCLLDDETALVSKIYEIPLKKVLRPEIIKYNKGESI